MILNILGPSRKAVKLANKDMILRIKPSFEESQKGPNNILNSLNLCKPASWKTGQIHFDEKTICEMFEVATGKEACVLMPFRSQNATLFYTSNEIANNFEMATIENVFEAIHERKKIIQFLNYQNTFIKSFIFADEFILLKRIDKLLQRKKNSCQPAPWFSNINANKTAGKENQIMIASPEYDPDAPMLDAFISPSTLLSKSVYDVSSPSYNPG